MLPGRVTIDQRGDRVYTKRIFWGVVLTYAGLTLASGGVKVAAKLHATQDPETSFPARLGRAVIEAL